ncbi:hypothetical protein, partial [Staphylococcus epidermidis]|uniref:hypothetical protein n=1 Tax=Staphylococcus epidermidis TaxID=1282 RepID=UPI001C92D2C8
MKEMILLCDLGYLMLELMKMLVKLLIVRFECVVMVVEVLNDLMGMIGMIIRIIVMYGCLLFWILNEGGF